MWAGGPDESTISTKANKATLAQKRGRAWRGNDLVPDDEPEIAMEVARLATGLWAPQSCRRAGIGLSGSNPANSKPQIALF